MDELDTFRISAAAFSDSTAKRDVLEWLAEDMSSRRVFLDREGDDLVGFVFTEGTS